MTETVEHRLWLRTQLTLPQSMYSITELEMLSGLPRKRLVRYLEQKKLIVVTSSKKKHLVDLDTLTNLAPEFWNAIKKRIAGGLAS